LIVVLGHTHCGAVEEAFKQAADTHEKQKEDALESPIEEVVREILEVTGEYTDTSAMEIENARAGVEKLRKDPTLACLAADGELAILAAIYDTESGFVRFDI
jgi:carbonic anhydrase